MNKRRRWLLLLPLVALLVLGVWYYEPPGPVAPQPQDSQQLLAMKWIFRVVSFLYICLMVVLLTNFVRHLFKSAKLGQPLPTREEMDEEDRNREF
jgi:quinol-cytochrome oxidoreductase complex cytochrome b subunit